jgi:ABC-2 family transporter protein
LLSFPFIAGAFATFVITERQSKAKHLQTVAGVQPTAYWLSTFLWDTLNYQLPLWSTVALMFIFDVKLLTTTDNDVLSGVIALLFFFGPGESTYQKSWN